ncbi:unnamed protein product [Alopecurus aequalis]
MAMYPLLVVFLLTAASGAFGGDPIASATQQAVAKWKEAVPGSPLPEAIRAAISRGDRNCFGRGGCTLAPQISVQHASCRMLAYKYADGDKSCSEVVATTGLFFNEGAVHAGSIMTLSSPPTPEMVILPRKVADRMPFDNVSSILQMFHIMPRSHAAADVEETLHKCLKPVHDKKEACAASLDEVLQVAIDMLGTPKLEAAASALPSAGLPTKAYIVQAVRPLSGSLFVACHIEPYPYTIYYCHTTGLSKAYTMFITSEEGGAVTQLELVVVCHQDTSDWNPNHPAFKALRTKPGVSPICHYIPFGHLIFGKKI